MTESTAFALPAADAATARPSAALVGDAGADRDARRCSSARSSRRTSTSASTRRLAAAGDARAAVVVPPSSPRPRADEHPDAPRLARRARGPRRPCAAAAPRCAFVVQAGYFAYEVHDFADQLHATDITRDAYTSIYYTLLGADHAHVFVGLLLDVWLLAKLAGGLTTLPRERDARRSPGTGTSSTP